MDWEENTVKGGMMLNPMPIPHAFQLNEIIVTSRTIDRQAPAHRWTGCK